MYVSTIMFQHRKDELGPKMFLYIYKAEILQQTMLLKELNDWSEHAKHIIYLSSVWLFLSTFYTWSSRKK